MDINQRPNIETVLLASRVPFNDNLYVVGPYARRVSFASQQRRALSLVWAINADIIKSGDERGLRGKTVAVVGAGLAGLTVAMGLKAFQSVVHVYEKNNELLEDMLNASHRDIHPTMNFWPEEELLVTTELPFLNWHHNSCDMILEGILAEWEKFCKTNSINVNNNFTVTKLIPTLSNKQWQLKATRPSDDSSPDEIFDVVILATGFGPSKSELHSSTGYWNKRDDVIFQITGGDEEKIKEKFEACKKPCDNYVISGSGDGGVIEALRLIYFTFRAGSIEPTTRKIISHENVPSKILAIESAAKKMMNDGLLHGEQTKEEVIRLNNEVSNYLWAEYFDLISTEKFGDFDTVMDKNRTKIPKVYLVDYQQSPLKLSVSPYHKLLLTYAIKKGYVEYYQKTKCRVKECSLLDTKFPDAISARIDRKHVSIFYARYFELNDAVKEARLNENALEPLELSSCLYLTRHAPTSPLESLLSGIDEKLPAQVKKRQSLYADLDWLTLEQLDFYTKAFKDPSPKKSNAWANKHIDSAIKYFKKNHGVQVGKVVFEKNAKFRLTKINKAKYESIFEATKFFMPRSFYGILVEDKVLEYDDLDDGGIPK